MTKFRARLLAAGLALGVSAAPAFAQGFGGPGGRGMPTADDSFNRLLASYGGSGDVLDYGRLPAEERSRMTRMATFTNSPPPPAAGTVTREQFRADFDQRMAAMRARFQQGGGFGGDRGDRGRGGDSGDDAERRFREYDKNADGRITPDEASDRWRGQFPQIDKNSDGIVDLNEYKEYRNNRGNFSMTPGAPGVPTPAPGAPAQSFTPPPSYDRGDRGSDRNRPAEEEDAPRPTVIRFGKLPKEVPSWFEKIDGDADGQIGLYEWRGDGRATADFADMDQNGDGYLTAEEWLRHQKAAYERPAGEASSASSGGSRPERTSDRPERDKGDKSDKRERGSNPFMPRPK